jgi:chromosome segregation ATPase
MADDLVKRLRWRETSGAECLCGNAVCGEAADRLEQLESSSEGWKEIADEYFDAIGERNTRIEKLEEQAHYANGVADLAMKHRDYAEQRVEKLEAALLAIVEDEVPRDVAIPYRDDGLPSKHDRCPHSEWMYNYCSYCIMEYAEKKLEELK